MRRLTALLAAAVVASLALVPAARAEFGVEAGSFIAGSFNDDGTGIFGTNATSDTRSGGHPFQATTSFSLNTLVPPAGGVLPDGTIKDTVVRLPPGFLGNPQATPQCPEAVLEAKFACPNDTAVGVAYLEFILLPLGNPPGPKHPERFYSLPVYNMIPGHGEPALFGFHIPEPAQTAFIHLRLDSSRNYAVTASVSNISNLVSLYSSKVTIWGVPADPSHDPWRGFYGVNNIKLASGCLDSAGISQGDCPSDAQPPKALVTDPTACEGEPLLTKISIDSWQLAGRLDSEGEPDLSDPAWTSAVAASPAPTGCAHLLFGGPHAPVSFTFQPAVPAAGAPSGYEAKLNLPYDEKPEDLANPTLRDAKVSLPEGVVVNPSSANGLDACTSAEIGLTTPIGATPIRFDGEPANCPNASKIGTVEVHSPLVDHPLEGDVYLAAQGDNPFGSLLAIYLVVDDPATGVIVKLAGHVEADPVSGRLTTTFTENPQLPLTELDLLLFGGPHASLVNPSTCGSYTTTSDLTPWSAPQTPDATTSDSFQINQGCSALGFTPSFSAGTVNNQAGAFSPFSVTLSRTDQDQQLGAIRITTPPGLLGKLSAVPLCGEPQAALGTCSSASQIGHATVGAGAGSSPIYLPVAGQPPNPVYLTTGYKGAPFGLSVVVPAIAGPFDLGTVVVRAAINVDPHTSQITITSDPPPTILDGIPLQLKTVNVTVDRPGFMFNPTNCNPMTINGTVTSTQGATVAVSSRFQAANCATLPFNPAFSATTAANGNFHGASLDVKVTQKPGEAAIHKVDTQLPLALPSRLVTLQKACTEEQFAANPAGCPTGSVVGAATAITPILNAPLVGPAYLVSHGGAAFPDLDVILESEGVKIDLIGNTDIKKGITFSRFETVPDAPISSFELNLPGGPGAVLAATKNLCAPTKTVTVSKEVTRRVRGHSRRVVVKVKQNVPEALLMPTTITGQNGAVTQQSVKIAVTGCKKAKAKAKPKAKAKVRKVKETGKASRRASAAEEARTSHGRLVLLGEAVKAYLRPAFWILGSSVGAL